MGFVRRLATILYWLLCTVLVVAMVLVAAFVVTVRQSIPDRDGEVSVGGLHDAVDVKRDQYGVPQITAGSAHDLFFAQGWVHAQDRFWEMDVNRHLSAGRLAELFGAGQVETDKYLRTMGWRDVAEREYPLLSRSTKDALTAYAAGVNAYLGDHRGSALGLEYTLLRLQNGAYRPERWSPVDSLAWLKVMAWQLRGNDVEEQERTLLSARLSAAQVDELYPAYPYREHEPIVSGGTVTGGTFVPTDVGGGQASRVPPAARAHPALRTGAAGASLARARVALDAVSGAAGASGDGIGSNAWVVAGSRTSTGRPILANDPHLGPAMPSIWYQMSLRCAPVSAACPYDVGGFTFAGFPGVIIGHNDRIAWGFTNLGPDVVDLYLERVEGDTYEYRGERVDLATRDETIKVAGGDPVSMTVRSTRHGPLLSDASGELRDVGEAAPGGAKYAVAMRWTALTPGRTADAVLVLNAASNFTEFRAAARLFEVPAQNLVYADVDGHIGYQAPGRVPIRSGYDGRYPAIGWTGEHDWAGFVPFRALPYALDPKDGYVVTANQAVIGDSYPYELTRDWDYGFRSSRITDMIESARGPVTVADTSSMQHDTRNAAAEILVPHLRRAHAPAGAAAAQRLLSGWDYTTPPDSAPAAYFNSVWKHVLARTFDDQVPAAARPDGGARWFEVVDRLVESPRSPWWDDVRTRGTRETRDDVLVQAMGDAYDELAERLGTDPARWRWGDLHTLTVRNQTFGTSGIGAVERLFNRGPVRLGGGSSVVNATGWSTRAGYEVDWVPSMRMIVDLRDLDRSRWVNLTGSSGHPFDRHYFDQSGIWVRGTTPMRWRQGTIDRGTIYGLVLRPAG